MNEKTKTIQKLNMRKESERNEKMEIEKLRLYMTNKIYKMKSTKRTMRNEK